ncbi:MAG: helix-turn-helix domain-containing protein [Thaumarchaeota archaeon]|nr:helix-turn-helix domain-containing protein [Nitrososphaerota archaeon]
MKAVVVVDDPKVAELLIDPMRRTILNILADRTMTESQLSESLGLTGSAVGHHLRALEGAGLVRIVKRELEVHGILQKFYGACALSFVVDTRKMPQEVSRYFFPINIERFRGVLSVLQTLVKGVSFPTASVERMSEVFAHTLAEVAESYQDREVSVDRETFTVKLYGEALLEMLRRKDKDLQPLRETLGRLVSARIR